MAATNTPKDKSLARFAWLSIAAALTTIALKTIAYLLTGSVGLLSDAMESFINLAGAIMALAMLKIASRPADEEHTYGHGKAEYFSSGVEGAMIVVAAISISITAVHRLLNPRPVEQLGIGLAISVVATFINLYVGIILLKAGRKYYSITLEADAQHLMTDVWTSAGVLAGVGAVALTGWQRLDPIVALLVAANIIWSGTRIIRRSVMGLMDTSLPAETQAIIREVLKTFDHKGIKYHALRSRQSGAQQFVSFHVLVPGNWTVQEGHQLLEQIEASLHHRMPNIIVFTHLESLDDPASWDDIMLEQKDKQNTINKN